jgi:hypothetical protein
MEEISINTAIINQLAFTNIEDNTILGSTVLIKETSLSETINTYLKIL